MGMTGSAKTHQNHRTALRKRLRAAGYSEAYIERTVEELRQRQQAARDSGQPLADVRQRTLSKQAERAETRRVHREIDRQFNEIQRRSMEEYRARQEREQEALYARLNPDDSKYRPSAPDALERGAARVSGITAKVAKRRTTIRKYDYDAEAAS